jgi:hypothetical protein
MTLLETNETFKTLDAPKNLGKSELLRQWRDLEPNQDPLSVMQPITGGGSSYGGDGIRICGSAEFVSCVLSRLQDMTDGENDLMILKASHSIVKPTEINGKVKDWKYSGGHCVYIQLGIRSGCGIGDSAATNSYIDRVPGLRAKLKEGRIKFYMWLGMSLEEAQAYVK